MRIFIIFLLILMGCEEEDQTIEYTCPDNFIEQYDILPLYISASCKTETRKVILSAIDAFNDLTQDHLCQERINLIGEIDVDTEIKKLEKGRNILVCYNHEPEWFVDSKWVEGTAASAQAITRYEDTNVYIDRYIRLFLFKRYYSNAEIKRLIMHELMHFSFGTSHLDPEVEYGVLTPDINYQANNYTQDDIDLMCDKVDCVND